MTMGASAAAARAYRLRLQQEEEEMTSYSQEEGTGDWEFKIVRSNFAKFQSAEAFNRLVQEESIAGWILVEKFDDSRVRFKRPRAARQHDEALPPGVDPYRTQANDLELSVPRPILVSLIGMLVGGVILIWLLLSG